MSLSEIFSKWLPLAAECSVRLILPNRRGYPGSDAYDDEEAGLLEKPEPLNLEEFFRLRACELFDFLSEFVEKEKVNEKGLIVGGWSYGNVSILAFLAHVDEIAAKNPAVQLHLYI